MKIYDCLDYKSVLRAAMKERQGQFGSRFTYEKMALACGVQKTYLSKVMNKDTHLNPDQLFSACEYLQLDPVDTEYLILLREREVAQNPKRAKTLDAKISKIQKAKLKTEESIFSENSNSVQDNKWEYYTDIDMQLTHMFLTVPQFAKSPQLICLKIGINEIRLQSILLKLESWDLIKYQEGHYKAQDPKMHLSEDSPVVLTFRILNRIKTIEKLRKSDNSNVGDYFFSVNFSASRQFQLDFRKKLLQLIKNMQREVIASKPEEVYQFNLDLFRWS